MKDEIKEIMHNLKECCDIHKDENWVVYQKDKIYQLLDCITNLQEENRQTKLLKERYQLEKEDYKSRNEKAIEYIKENCIDDEFYINLTNKEKHIIQALDILQGEDKDED